MTPPLTPSVAPSLAPPGGGGAVHTPRWTTGARCSRNAGGVTNSVASGQPPLTRPLYGHLVAATMVDCLVIVTALAARSMAPWAAGLILASTLALAGHAAHVRRNCPQVAAEHGRTGVSQAASETDTGTGDRR